MFLPYAARRHLPGRGAHDVVVSGTIGVRLHGRAFDGNCDIDFGTMPAGNFGVWATARPANPANTTRRNDGDKDPSLTAFKLAFS